MWETIFQLSLVSDSLIAVVDGPIALFLTILVIAFILDPVNTLEVPFSFFHAMGKLALVYSSFCCHLTYVNDGLPLPWKFPSLSN
jgi:hypothetical protein